MWLASLQNSRSTAYFNAWSDDYSNDPLPALLATFKSLKGEDKLTDSKRKIWEEIVGFSGKLVKNALPALAGLLAKRYIGVDNIDKLGEALTKGGIEYINDEVKDFSERQEDLKKLQQLLTDFVSEKDQKKKAVIVIDELDRCRPHYAVAVLELIKHLFNVNGVVFVLAIDKEQLKHAICGVYGSEKLDANTYLQRFIDIEYKLPKAETSVLIDYLVNQYILGLVNGVVMNRRIQELPFEVHSFKRFIVAFQEHRNLPIRSLEKILITTKLALDTIRPQGYLLPEFLFVLAYFNQFHFDLMKSIKEKVWDTKEMLEQVQKLLTPLDETSNIPLETFVHVEACLTLFYNNYTSTRKRYNLNSDSTYFFNGNNYGLQSKYLTANDQLKIQIEALGHNYDRANRVPITYFINKIEQFQEIEI